MNLIQIVNEMRFKNNIDNIIKIIKKSDNLLEKCILGRKYLSPQSTIMENIIKNDLKIKNRIDKNSGDGCKNNINYEIKCSIHDKLSKFNFVQIRPDHNVDFYIFVCYNINIGELGNAYILKIPAINIHELILHFGNYAHGTKEKLGNITKDNIKGNNYEYCLRANQNCNKKNKSFKLWKELLKYQVSYDPYNF
jgi:hypothetical protein